LVPLATTSLDTSLGAAGSNATCTAYARNTLPDGGSWRYRSRRRILRAPDRLYDDSLHRNTNQGGTATAGAAPAARVTRTFVSAFEDVRVRVLALNRTAALSLLILVGAVAGIRRAEIYAAAPLQNI